MWFLLFLMMLIILLHARVKESYESLECAECGGRIQFAQVLADPNNLGGMGWVL